jgi:L-seryl-tRNA(Ser) seleniumtransferase
MTDQIDTSPYRLLPSVEEVACLFHGQEGGFCRPVIVEAARRAVEEERERLRAGHEPVSREALLREAHSRAAQIAAAISRPGLRRVINATGVILHTNLGRAILARQAVEQAMLAASGFTNLEFDLEQGRRGSRGAHLKPLLRELAGAEDAMLVNNNAAALLLMLDTFARGREVVVSRGELVEIGGSFRLPEVLAKGGAIMREVGCTNRTHLYDYRDAINENTAMLLKTHKSNFAIKGFQKEVPGDEIAALARERGIISAEDLGSGLLIDLAPYGLPGEVTVKDVVKSGIDLVTFSGDKLLGGPQGGIVVGSSSLIEKMEKNPLARALRPDKLTIAAMEATLFLYRDPESLEKNLPFLWMLAQGPSQVEKRAMALLEQVEGDAGKKGILSIIDGVSQVGGGAFPDRDIPTRLIAARIPGVSPQALRRILLDRDPPVVSRIEEDSLVLDLRTVQGEEEMILADILSKTIRENI